MSDLPPGSEIDDKQQIFWAYLVEGIVDSSLWQLGTKDERLLFITLLAKKKRNGCVYYKSLPGLMRWAHLTMKETQDALAGLQKPDPHSGSKVLDGRRIIPIEGVPITSACQMVNAKYYQKLIQAQIRKDYQAEWQKGYRVKKKALTETLTNVDTPLTYTNTDTKTNTKELFAEAYMPICPKRDGKEKPKPLDAALEAQLGEELKELFGEDDWKHFGGIWTLRWRENLTKLQRVIAEVESMRRESKIHISIGGTANDLWKRFAPKTIW